MKRRQRSKMRYVDAPESVKRNLRSDALVVARRHRVPLESIELVRVRVPDGTPDVLRYVGVSSALEYKTGRESNLPRGAWRHESGDHGKGRKKTKPMILCADRSGRPVLVPSRGSRVTFTARGLGG
jgi:hypothetical protein